MADLDKVDGRIEARDGQLVYYETELPIREGYTAVFTADEPDLPDVPVNERGFGPR